MIDLHMHSLFSDGMYSPEDLMIKIAEKKLKAVALTDHDSVLGCERFALAGQKHKVMTIHASEMSVNYPKVSMEIVALDIPEKNLPSFIEFQKNMKDERIRVTEERLKLLVDLGIRLNRDEVFLDSNGVPRNQVGKPHVVQAMLKGGYINNWDEGFTKYLNKGSPAYVPKNEPLFSDVISFVLDNGAVPVLAHPIHTKKTGKELFELFKELKSCGLAGVEVFHSDHNSELKKEYLEMIKELKLISSGGSDYHGGAHPDVEIGCGKGDLKVPDVIFEVIKTREKPLEGYYSDLAKYI